MTHERLDLTDMVPAIDLPCDATLHPDHSTAPATWVVWQVKCCPNRPEIGLLCDACLIRVLACDFPTRCRDCGYKAPHARDLIVRYERITHTPKPPTGNPPTGS